MNVETADLVRVVNEAHARELAAQGYEPVPKALEEEARAALAGKNATKVDLSVDSPLARWAKKKSQGRNERCRCGSGKFKNCCGQGLNDGRWAFGSIAKFLKNKEEIKETKNGKVG
jgi:hypothetical protein